MSYINDLYVFVSDEDVTRGVTVSEHTVEQGVDITDHIKPEPVELSLKGKLVGENASATLGKLYKQMHDGELVNYIGRNIIKNLMITSFNTSHPNTIWGGCDFDMTLKEIKVADPSFRTEARLNSGTQQLDIRNSNVKIENSSEKIYHTVKKGDSVYALVSADNAPYKKYGFTADDVVKNNPKAFADLNDYSTLIIGVKLWIGNR